MTTDLALSVIVFCDEGVCQQLAERCADQLGVPCVSVVTTDVTCVVHVTSDGVFLLFPAYPRWRPWRVDFLSSRWLRRAGAIRHTKELLAQAVGVSPGQACTVLDATAGCGEDGWLLALMGCDVTLCERSPVMAMMLQDGVLRAQHDARFQHVRAQCVASDATEWLRQGDRAYDVIYLDPMFPETGSSAVPQKTMVMLRELVGTDPDADQLLEVVWGHARQRIVVKRSKVAPVLAGRKPSFQKKGRTHRFDVYLCQ